MDLVRREADEAMAKATADAKVQHERKLAEALYGDVIRTRDCSNALVTRRPTLPQQFLAHLGVLSLTIPSSDLSSCKGGRPRGCG